MLTDWNVHFCLLLLVILSSETHFPMFVIIENFMFPPSSAYTSSIELQGQVFVTVPLSGLYVVIPSLEIERIRLYKPFHLWTLMQKKDTPHNGFYWINVQFTGRTPSKLLWKSETGISLRFWEIELIQNRGYFVFLHLCIVEGECYLDRFSSPP